MAHDLTRLVVEGRPGTQARSPAGLDAFFSRPRRCTVGLASGRDFGFGPRRVSETAFFPQEIDPLHQTVSPRATFISFRNVVAAPRYPDGRYAAGYRGAIKARMIMTQRDPPRCFLHGHVHAHGLRTPGRGLHTPLSTVSQRQRQFAPRRQNYRPLQAASSTVHRPPSTCAPPLGPRLQSAHGRATQVLRILLLTSHAA